MLCLASPTAKNLPAALRSASRGQDFALHLVHVLELVHHQVIDPVDGGLDALVPRLGGQQAPRQPLQIVEVQRAQLRFQAVVDVGDKFHRKPASTAAPQPPARRSRPPARSQPRFGQRLAERSDCLEPILDLVQTRPCRPKRAAAPALTLIRANRPWPRRRCRRSRPARSPPGHTRRVPPACPPGVSTTRSGKLRRAPSAASSCSARCSAQIAACISRTCSRHRAMRSAEPGSWANSRSDRAPLAQQPQHLLVEVVRLEMGQRARADRAAPTR